MSLRARWLIRLKKLHLCLVRSRRDLIDDVEHFNLAFAFLRLAHCRMAERASIVKFTILQRMHIVLLIARAHTAVVLGLRQVILVHCLITEAILTDSN